MNAENAQQVSWKFALQTEGDAPPRCARGAYGSGESIKSTLQCGLPRQMPSIQGGDLIR